MSKRERDQGSGQPYLVIPNDNAPTMNRGATAQSFGKEGPYKE
jgi:hypothetical protein